MRILNDEEICRLLDVSTEYDYINYDNCETVSTIDIRPALKAQQHQDIKDFVEWGNEECFEHPYSSKAKGEAYNRKRHRCPECWVTLKGLVGLNV